MGIEPESICRTAARDDPAWQARGVIDEDVAFAA
jgi:hypothetical protein